MDFVLTLTVVSLRHMFREIISEVSQTDQILREKVSSLVDEKKNYEPNNKHIIGTAIALAK